MRSFISLYIAILLSVLLCTSETTAHDHNDKETVGDGEPHGEAGSGIKLTEDGQTTIGIQIRSAERRALPGKIVTTGKLEAIPTQEFVQHAPIAGRVEQVFVQPGQYVQPRQILIRLSSPDLQQLSAQLLQEKTQIEAEVTTKRAEFDGEVSQAKTQLDLSEASYKRELQLFEEKINSQKSMQQAKADLDLATNRLSVAKQKREAALNALRARLAINVDALKQRLRQLGASEDQIKDTLASRTGITTLPVRTIRGGLITQLVATAGQSIDPSDPLVKVSNLNTLWATANIYESDMSKVRIGQPIVVRIAAFPKQQFAGRVTFISSEVDPVTRTLSVKFEVVNQDNKLKPGMFAELSVQTAEPVISISLPKDAVIADKGHYIVYVQEGDEYKPTLVEIGSTLGDEIEIRSGISASQKIVVRGAFQLDAQRLKSIGDTALFTHPTEEGHEEHEHEEGESKSNNQLLNPQLFIIVAIAFVFGCVITAMVHQRRPFMIETKPKIEPKVPDTEKSS